jgi:hypothetical protein
MTRREVGAFDAIGKIDWDRFRFGFYCLSTIIAENRNSASDRARKAPITSWRSAILKTALAPGEPVRRERWLDDRLLLGNRP